MDAEAAKVHVRPCDRYDEGLIASLIPDHLFLQITPGDKVVLKPNWVLESHRHKVEEWESVITHPSVVGAVVGKVLTRLAGKGRISILDGPMTEASFEKLISRYPVQKWQDLAQREGVALEIIDLRDHAWKLKNGVIVERNDLRGDPRGKVVVDLAGESSEFWGQKKSKRGYYGADYNISETNEAHDGHRNLYSVSRTVVEADVFINLPKLKTHRKAGITCCLKNLVGINTYKNYLPHHSEGGPSEGGDQFPADNLNARLEGPMITFLKQHLLQNQALARMLSPFKRVAVAVFGDSAKVIRSGSWHGNDTLWRTIIDLNKVLFYCDPAGKMAAGKKRYIGVVDAIVAGEGDGPLSPDPVRMGYLICGLDPGAIDAASAGLMGFDLRKIPSIAKAFSAHGFNLCSFTLEQVRLCFDGWECGLEDIPRERVVPCRPHHGWQGHIEMSRPSVASSQNALPVPCLEP